MVGFRKIQNRGREGVDIQTQSHVQKVGWEVGCWKWEEEGLLIEDNTHIHTYIYTCTQISFFFFKKKKEKKKQTR
jgi:hypothetical protein